MERTGGNRNVRIVRELPETPRGAQQVLVEMDGRYYIVSSVVAMFTGFETLVFGADENGGVVDYCEIAGWRGCSREDAINALAALGDEEIERYWSR